MKNPFTVGQLIGSAPDGSESTPGCISISDQAVQIRINAEIDNGGIVATVTALGNFYSQRNLDHGFILGEALMLRPRGDVWIITEPRDRPWHILGVRDGKPYFEHYR
jgi:hypothetical protein